MAQSSLDRLWHAFVVAVSVFAAFCGFLFVMVILLATSTIKVDAKPASGGSRHSSARPSVASISSRSSVTMPCS